MWGAILVLVIMAWAVGSVIWSSIQNGISPMPTSLKVRRDFIKSLPQHIDGKILELGAGWGSLAFPLAERYPDATVIAYENSWIPYLFCRMRHWYRPLPNLTFVRRNFFVESFHEAGLVICYLYPGAMKKLKDKFQAELTPSALVATHTFAIPGWTPHYKETVADLYHTTIYHYTGVQRV